MSLSPGLTCSLSLSKRQVSAGNTAGRGKTREPFRVPGTLQTLLGNSEMG